MRDVTVKAVFFLSWTVCGAAWAMSPATPNSENGTPLEAQRPATVQMDGLPSGQTSLNRISDEHIPENLTPWKGWAIQGKEKTQCHLKFSRQGTSEDDYSCVGVGVAQVTLNENSSSENKVQTLSIEVDVEGVLREDHLNLLPLPSANRQQVEVWLDGKPARILQKQNQSWAKIPQGQHRLRVTYIEADEVLTWPKPWHAAVSQDQPLSTNQGKLFWTERPKTLPEQDQMDHVELKVYRKWHDQSVPTLETRMVLNVSGNSRWHTWKNVLPQGFEMTSWQAEWPVQWTKDNTLSVKLNQGKGVVVLQARCVSCSEHVQPVVQKGWPKSEIWSFETENHVRQLSFEGHGVDPQQAGVPSEWNGFQAYRLSPQTPLKILERARGGAAPTELQVARKAWYDGTAWFVEDTLKGVAPSGTRLELQSPYHMVSFAQQQRHLPLTEQSGRVGVNWGGGPIEAVVRFTTDRLSHTSGWNVPVQQLQQTLYTAPHHRVVHIDSGKQQYTWVSRLNVWVFFCAFILFWITKSIMGWAWGALVFVLTMAPVTAYSFVLGGLWFVVVVMRLIADRLYSDQPVHKGWINLILWGAIALAGAIWLTQWSTHVRQMIYPNLDVHIGQDLMHPDMPPEERMMQGMGKGRMSAESMAMDAGASSSAKPAQSSPVPSDPVQGLGVLQAGLSSPLWYSGMSQSFSQGPILANESQRVWILPHWLWSALHMIQFLLWAFLWIKLMGWALKKTWRFGPKWIQKLFTVGLLCLPLTAMAQTADQVNELSQRMTQAPSCAPQCAAVIKAQGLVEGRTLTVRLVVDVSYRSGVWLPEIEGGYLNAVQTDQRKGVMDGSEVLVEEGVHTIEAQYVLTQPQAVLSFKQHPLSLTAAGTQWDIQATQGQWTLTRSTTQSSDVRTSEEEQDQRISDIPRVDLRVLRRVHLGQDVSMQTTVTRLGKLGEGKSFVPLMQGERGVQEHQLQDHGRWVIVWKEGQRSFTYESRLDVQHHLVLQAMSANEGSETWHITHGPTWSLGKGNVPRSFVSPKEHTFFPKPKETLILPLSKPQFSKGHVIRVQKVDVRTARGEKISTHQLHFDAFATQGAQLQLTLPAESQLKHVLIDQVPVALPFANSRLTVPLGTGMHQVQVEWTTLSQKTLDRIPTFSFDQPVSNIQWRVDYPDRWVVWTHGERWGMSIMYWPYLVILLFLAWIASKMPWLGLSMWQALLLTLGLSLLATWALLLVAGWLALIHRRERMTQLPTQRHAFNNVQILLAFLTLLTVGVVFVQVTQGLMGASPNMFMRAPVGLDLFAWFNPSSSGLIQSPTIVSFDMWVYRILICAWALWMAKWLTQALQRALKAWTHLGHWMSEDLSSPHPKDEQ